MQQERPPITGNLLIRSASDEDFPAIAGLVTGPDELFRVFPAARWPLNVRQIRRLAERRVNLTVASSEDKVVAFANLYDVQPEKWAFIGNIVVHQAERGRGAGRALVNYMLDLIFVKHALPEARISVFSENTPALQLYKSMGFAEYDRESRKDPQDREITIQHLKLGRTK